MKKVRPVRLGKFLIYRTALLAAAPFAAFFLTAAFAINGALARNAFNGLAYLAETMAEETTVRLDASVSAVETVAAHVETGALDPRGSAEEIEAYGRAVLSRNPNLSALWLLDAGTGTVRTAVPVLPGAIGFDLSRSETFLRARESTAVWSPIGLSPFFAGVTISLSVKAGDCIVVAWLEPAAIVGLVEARRLGSTGFAFACDSDGLLVAHPDRELVERRQSLFSIPAVSEAAKGRPAISVVDGRIYAAHPAGRHGWIVGIAQDEAEIRSFLPAIAAGGAGAFALSFLFIVVGAGRSARKTAKHLAELVDGADAAARGEYGVSLDPQPFIEFETLRNSFLTMLDAVREREDQFRAVFENAPMPMVVGRVGDRTTLDANPAYLRLLDKPREEVVGKDPSGHESLFDRETTERMADEFKKSGRLRDFEANATRPDGGALTFLVSTFSITFGREDCVVSIFQDITERKRTEERMRGINLELEAKVEERTAALRETNEELSVAMENLEVAQERVVTAEKLAALGQLSAGIAHELNTPLGAVISSNRSMVELLDTRLVPLSESIGAMGPEERRRFTRFLAVAGPRAAKLGNLELDRASKRALRDRLAAEGIPQAQEAAELLIELNCVDEVPAFVPDLREQGSVEVLRLCAELLAVRRLAEVVAYAAKKAAGVVGALRSYLRHETGAETEAVDVEAELDNVLTLLHGKIKHKVRIERDYAGVRVRGSAEKFSQVWMNLITNAVQAMNYEGELRLRTSDEGELVAVDVIDSGPGISDEARPRIFQPFFTTKKQGEGLGLGLDICRKIVTTYGGTIEFESEPGRTRFTVRLPKADGGSA